MPLAELLQWLSSNAMTLHVVPEVALEVASNHALSRWMQKLLQWLVLALLDTQLPHSWRNVFLIQNVPNPMVYACAGPIHLDNILKLLQMCGMVPG